VLVRLRCAVCGTLAAEVETDPDNPGRVRYRRRLVNRAYWAVTLHPEATCPEHGALDVSSSGAWERLQARVDAAQHAGRATSLRLAPRVS
jgi:hypothetical protein